MKDTVVAGGTVIEYTVTRSKRRKKTIGIQVGRSEGVVVAAPMRVSAAQIRQVVLKRADWILLKTSQVGLRPRRQEYVSGETLPFLGRDVPLRVVGTEKKRARLEFDQSSFSLVLPDHLVGEERRATAEKAVVSWFRARALEHLTERVEHWSRIAGYEPTRVLVRDQRARWGSCAPDGTLRFNWRLILTDPALVDYVVAHELAHVKVKNHSAVFWAEVHRLIPDAALRRKRLREVGMRLAL